MIDEKKIKKAARQISEKVVDAIGFDDSKPTHLAFLDGHVEGFSAGAKWAINKFLKSLWHSNIEKPNIKQGECCVTCLVKFKNGSTKLCIYFSNSEGWICDNMSSKDFKRNFKGWLYIDDLLPKKGGEQ